MGTKLYKQQEGFSFIELIVVIVIIGILASLSTIGINSVRVKVRDIKRNSDISQMQTALEMYRRENYVYPSNLTSGLPLAFGSQIYLDSVPDSPGKADGSCSSDAYTYTRDADGTSYHINYCLGASGTCIAVPGSLCISCHPSCTGKCTGGNDGCGGTCAGSCDSGYMCQSGTCVVEPGSSWRIADDTKILGSSTFATVKSNFDGTHLLAVRVVGATDDTYYYVSDDSGVSWTKRETGPLLYWASSEFWANAMDYSGEKLVVGSSYGQKGAWLSNDLGASWNELNPTGVGTKLDWYATAVDNDASVIAIASSQVSGQSKLFLSTNGGTSFTEQTQLGNNRAWRSIAIDDDGSFIIASSITNGASYDLNSHIFTTANSGTDWTERIPGGATASGRTDVDCDSDGSNLIAGYGGKLWTSSDGGVNWTERKPVGASFPAYTVSSNNDGSVLMAGAKSGRLYLSTDSGASWTEKYPPGGTPFADKPWWATAQDYDGSNLAAYSDKLYLSP